MDVFVKLMVGIDIADMIGSDKITISGVDCGTFGIFCGEIHCCSYNIDFC